MHADTITTDNETLVKVHHDSGGGNDDSFIETDRAIGISADNGAANTVTIGANLTSTATSDFNISDTAPVDRLLHTNEAIGISADNNARNNITVGGDIITATSSVAPNNISAKTNNSTVTNINHTVFITADNNAQNKVIAAHIGGSIPTDQYLSTNVTFIDNSTANVDFNQFNIFNMVGVAADHHANNDITANNIIVKIDGENTETGNASTISTTLANNSNLQNYVLSNNLTINMLGVLTDNGAHNKINLYSKPDYDPDATLQTYYKNSSAISTQSDFSSHNCDINNYMSNINYAYKQQTVSADHNATNDVTANSILAQYSSSITDQVNISTDSSHELNIKNICQNELLSATVQAVTADNSAHNTIKVQEISASGQLTFYDQKQDNDLNDYDPHKLQSYIYNRNRLFTVEAISAEHNAVNDITANPAVNISAAIDKDSTDSSTYGGMSINDQFTLPDFKADYYYAADYLKINLAAVNAMHSAQNLIAADMISATMDSINTSSLVDAPKDVPFDGSTIYNIRAVAADTGGFNQITADTVKSQIDNQSYAMTSSGKNCTTNFNIQAVYANNYSINNINSKNISAQIGDFQQGDRLNINAFNLSLAVDGIIGDNHAENIVNTNTITAMMGTFSPTVQNNPPDNVRKSNIKLSADGINAENGAHNTVTANSIEASAGNNQDSFNFIGINANDTPTMHIDAESSGARANNKGINDLTVNKIKATAALFKAGITDTSTPTTTTPSFFR